MNITLGPAMRVLVYSVVIGLALACSFYAGWSTHKFYGVSNELAINKDDAIISSKIIKTERAEINEIDKLQPSFRVVSDCDAISLDELFKSYQPGP